MRSEKACTEYLRIHISRTCVRYERCSTVMCKKGLNMKYKDDMSHTPPQLSLVSAGLWVGGCSLPYSRPPYSRVRSRATQIPAAKNKNKWRKQDFFCCRCKQNPAPTLQRHYTENAKQIFPEMKLRGLVPSSYIHFAVSNLYIPTIGLSILLQESWWTNLGSIKSLKDTWMWKLGLRPRSFFLGNT